MNETPSIFDIIGWLGDWGGNPDPSTGSGTGMMSLEQLIPGMQNPDLGGASYNVDTTFSSAGQGQKNMADYIFNLLKKQDKVPEDIQFHAQTWKNVDDPNFSNVWEEQGWDSWNVGIGDILGEFFEQETPFQDMSKEQMEALFTEGLVTPEGYDPDLLLDEGTGVEHAAYTGSTWWNETKMDEMVTALLSLQEGLGTLVTLESFNLKEKLKTTEDKTKRKSLSLADAFASSQFDRYDVLAGTEGPEKGEIIKADYLARMFGGQREQARDVRKTYGEYDEEFFGALGDFLGSLS